LLSRTSLRRLLPRSGSKKYIIPVPTPKAPNIAVAFFISDLSKQICHLQFESLRCDRSRMDCGSASPRTRILMTRHDVVVLRSSVIRFLRSPDRLGGLYAALNGHAPFLQNSIAAHLDRPWAAPRTGNARTRGPRAGPPRLTRLALQT